MRGIYLGYYILDNPLNSNINYGINVQMHKLLLFYIFSQKNIPANKLIYKLKKN